MDYSKKDKVFQMLNDISKKLDICIIIATQPKRNNSNPIQYPKKKPIVDILIIDYPEK